MNIIFTSDLSGLGGGEVSLLYIMEEMIFQGNRVGLICRYDGELVNRAKQIGATVWVCNYKRNFFDLIKLITKLKKHFHMDVIHSNELTSAIVFGFLSKLFSYKNVSTCHGQWYTISKIKRILINKYIGHIYCVSKAVKNNLERQKINNLSISYLGVPPEKFKISSEKKELMKNNLNLSDEFVILTIARYQEIKGQLKGVRAIESLIKKGYNIKYYLIGDNVFHNELDEKYKQEVLDYIHHNNLTKKIIPLGERNDIPELLSIADLVLITSDNESFGVVAIEALSANRVILSTPCDGIKEILDGDKDMISSENNSNSLENIIERYLADESLREKIKHKIPKYAGKFQVKTVVQNYCMHY